MISDPLARPEQVYVWIWLPGQVNPVPCGALRAVGDRADYAYGRSYLERDGRIPVYDDLPLARGTQTPPKGRIAGSLRDALPDRWGRRVLIHELTGKAGNDINEDQIDELALMLRSGSDRIGALDFQASPTEYVPREAGAATLEELQAFADFVSQGKPVPRELDRVILHGSSIGGARPKALLDDPANGRKLIAKFSASNDVIPMVRGEFLAMRLARMAGIDVANVWLEETAGRDVLVVERFDRIAMGGSFARRAMVSALTWAGEDELSAHHIAYAELADIVRARFRNAGATLRELFRRMAFNVLVGNTDDHARNHAAFWDGQMLELTPAYDVAPQTRGNAEANQALNIVPGDRRARLETCLAAAPSFHLSAKQARAEIDGLVSAIRDGWRKACDEARLSETDRKFFAGRQFLSGYAFGGYGPVPDLE